MFASIFFFSMPCLDVTPVLDYLEFKANVELPKAAEVFDSTLSTSSQIESAGERVLVVMYGGKSNESLNSLRHRKYCEKLASSLASVDP